MIEVFLIFLRLGLTSFGGPVAHLGYFQNEFVLRKKWLDDQSYADLVALCQFLPGPASSQIGMAIGASRAGIAGAIAAWVGFTLPSAILLVLFGFGISYFTHPIAGAIVHGLKVAAVAVVAQAIWSMGVKLCPDRKRALIAIFTAIFVTLIASAWGQVGAIVFAGLCGVFFLQSPKLVDQSIFKTSISRKMGICFLGVFLSLLLLLPMLASLSDQPGLKYTDSFYRAGSLVFGGGHVVLPLLQSEVVNPGWVTKDNFMAGYGAAQAIPGPLFSFAAYLGAVSQMSPSGWLGAGICLFAIFLPSFLLVLGVLPFWDQLKSWTLLRPALMGVNAAVVGLLAAAFVNPVWTTAILGPKDLILAALGVLLLVYKKWSSWSVVLICATIAGFIF